MQVVSRRSDCSRAIGHDDSSVGTFHSYVAKVNAAGEFEVRGVVPGAYVAQAEIPKGGLSYVGHTTVHVAGTDLDGIVLGIGEGMSMAGHLRVEGDTKPNFKKYEHNASAWRPNRDLRLARILDCANHR